MVTRPSKTMRDQIKALRNPDAQPPGTTTHKFTEQQAAIIQQQVQAVNQAQTTLNAVFVGILLGRDIDPDAVNCAIDPADVSQFMTQEKTS